MLCAFVVCVCVCVCMVYGRERLLVQRLQKHERVSGNYEEKKHTRIKGACTVSILPISNRAYARMLVPARQKSVYVLIICLRVGLLLQ